MDINEATILGLLALFVPVAGAVIIAIISRIKGSTDAVAVSASAILDLTDSVSKLTNIVDSERKKRQKGDLEFDAKISNLQSSYRQRIKALEADQKKAINELRVYYEAKIESIESAHRQRVDGLKQRINALEERQNGQGS